MKLGLNFFFICYLFRCLNWKKLRSLSPKLRKRKKRRLRRRNRRKPEKRHDKWQSKIEKSISLFASFGFTQHLFAGLLYWDVCKDSSRLNYDEVVVVCYLMERNFPQYPYFTDWKPGETLYGLERRHRPPPLTGVYWSTYLVRGRILSLTQQTLVD